MIEIKQFIETDTKSLIALVLHCQNDGTRPLLSVDDQPELLRIKKEYIDSGGNFWVAKDDGKLAGSIGLMNKGKGLGILKKFFVYEPYRGSPHYLGRRLYAVLLNFARQHSFRQLILDTPKNTERAHRFYEKSGFRMITREELPVAYDYPYEDSDFFCLDL